MDKQVKCPWCGETITPEISRSTNDYGHVIERRCPQCTKVLAAYAEEEGSFLADMRKF